MLLTPNGCVVRDKRICIDYITLRGITIQFKMLTYKTAHGSQLIADSLKDWILFTMSYELNAMS